MSQKGLVFYGAYQFRSIIACSILSSTPVEIRGIILLQQIESVLEIRVNDLHEPGINKYELNFLNLISILTNGTKVQLDETGTNLCFVPGVITNNEGKFCSHSCNLQRSISYYIEGILPIVMFGKDPLNLKLIGHTSDKIDCSVDSLRNVTLPLIKQFGIEELSIDIERRGFPPFDQSLSGTIGQVNIKLRSLIKSLIQPVNLEEEGRIKRIRGVASGVKVSPGSINEVISKIRGVFNKMLPDVWISTDLLKLDSGSGKKMKVSPNYGISLVAQSTTGSIIGSDCMIYPIHSGSDQDDSTVINQKSISQKKIKKFESQQNMADRCAQKFLNEIIGSGFVDSSNLGLALLLMALSSNQNVSKLKVRKIGKFSISLLQKIWKFFNVKFKFEECDDDIVYLDNQDDDDDDDDQQNDPDESQQTTTQFEKRIKSARTNLPKAIILSCLGCGLKNISRRTQ